MARKREDFPIEKVSLNLYQGEFKKLTELYPRMGAGKVIRVMVHNLLRQVDEKTAQTAPPRNLPVPEDIE